MVWWKFYWLWSHCGDNPNSIHAFNRFEEEGCAERKYNHFRFLDLPREELHAMEVPAILDDDDEEEENFSWP